MDASVKRDVWRVNIAGMLGSLYFQLALGQLLALYVTQCLGIPKEDWALALSIIPLTSALYVVSAYVTERLRRRKLISLSFFAIGRLATPAIMILPFITDAADMRLRLYYATVALIGLRGCSAMGSSAWMSWVADIVPRGERGRFYSVRLALNTVANIAVFVSAGRIIDYFSHGDLSDPRGYLVVFGAAFVLGELDLLIHATVRDRPMPEHAEKPRLLPLLAAPWRNSGFRNLILFRATVMFGNSLVSIFALMYLVEELGLRTIHVCVLTAVMMFFRVLAFPLWRNVGERVGYRTIYSVGYTMAGAGVVYWWFLRQDNFLVYFTVLVAARVYYGVVSAGLTLAHSTLTMDTAPDKHRSAYFAQVTTIMAVVSSLGIFCGRGIFLLTDPASDVTFLGTKLTGVHVLIGLVGIFRLVIVRLFYRRIPDAKAEAALPRIDRVLRTNPVRIFPTLLPLEAPLSRRERSRHVDSMKELLPDDTVPQVGRDVETVLKDEVHEEDEFYGILDRVRGIRVRGIGRMVNQIAESAQLHIDPGRARAAARRIRRQYADGDLTGCLRTVWRLAHRTADGWRSGRARSALSVIDALAETAGEDKPPQEEAVLLAMYAYLQIVREPED
jgi:Na+/melibiose symporter-like transporter